VGKHRSVVPHQQIVELVKLFAQADFYSLADKYELGNSEGSYVTTSIEINGRRKQLLDISGVGVGMPLAVQSLEEAIDRIAGSERWIHGNAETLAALEAEHWDLKSHAAAVALARLADFGNPDVALELIHAGTPVGWKRQPSLIRMLRARAAPRWSMPPAWRSKVDAGPARCRRRPAIPEIMDRALFDSASEGHLDAFHLLLANGANANRMILEGGRYLWQPHLQARLPC